MSVSSFIIESFEEFYREVFNHKNLCSLNHGKNPMARVNPLLKHS